MTTTDKGLLTDVHICTSESAYTALTKADDELYFVPDSSATQDGLDDANDRIDDLEDELGDSTTSGTINYKIAQLEAVDVPDTLSASLASGTGYKVTSLSLKADTTSLSSVDVAMMYTATGSNEDGSMTQKAITDALASVGETWTELPSSEWDTHLFQIGDRVRLTIDKIYFNSANTVSDWNTAPTLSGSGSSYSSQEETFTMTTYAGGAGGHTVFANHVNANYGMLMQNHYSLAQSTGGYTLSVSVTTQVFNGAGTALDQYSHTIITSLSDAITKVEYISSS